MIQDWPYKAWRCLTMLIPVGGWATQHMHWLGTKLNPTNVAGRRPCKKEVPPRRWQAARWRGSTWLRCATLVSAGLAVAAGCCNVLLAELKAGHASEKKQMHVKRRMAELTEWLQGSTWLHCAMVGWAGGRCWLLQRAASRGRPRKKEMPVRRWQAARLRGSTWLRSLCHGGMCWLWLLAAAMFC